MTRLLDANTLYAGAEPKIVGDLTRLQLMKALNWYSQNKDAKDSLKWASEQKTQIKNPRSKHQKSKQCLWLDLSYC